MTAASKVTLTRIFMIPVYLILMYISDGGSGAWMWGALGVFILASVTDFVDGGERYLSTGFWQVFGSSGG